MQPDALERLLEQGIEAFEQDDAGTAAERFEDVLKADPTSLDARLFLMEIALEEADPQRAVELAQEVLEIEPDHPEAPLMLADAYLQLELPEKALELCDELLQQDVHNLEARFFMAEALLELGGAAEAAQLYESVVEENPKDVRSLLALGVAWYESCNFDKAEAVLKSVLDRDSSIPDAYFFLGLLQERQGDEATAEAIFQKAREMDPESYPPPLTLSLETFEAVAREVLTLLPPKLRDHLADVTISVEEFPSDATLHSEDPPLSPSLWGIFRGPNLPDQTSTEAPPQLPAEIILYRRNLQRGVRSRTELLEEIRVTLLHEIGHFLGLDEAGVAALGLA